MQVVLTVVEGPHTGRTFAFDQHDHFFVGRAKFAQFRLPEKDPYFSRLHFLIEVNPPECRLLDLDSTNGTKVNGQKVKSADLRHGDQIKAGSTAIRVTIRDAFDTDPGTSGAIIDQLPDTAVKPEHGSVVPKQTMPMEIDLVTAGWKLPGYELTAVLGRGNMGIVYRGARLADQQRVAVKVIEPKIIGTSNDTQRFLREIDILRQLNHPGIVRLLDSGESEGLLYFTMELVEGVDARQYVERNAELLAPAVAIKIITRVLEGLHHAHDLGFVHRDVKPSNIMLSNQEHKLSVKLTDFGLARAYEQSPHSGLTLTGDICGTPSFMAPEQITDCRTVKPVSDQYSAAATLYWLLTKQMTQDFHSGLQQMLRQILLNDPVPILKRRPDLPPALAAAIHRALAKEPEDRFASAAEFRQALEAIHVG